MRRSLRSVVGLIVATCAVGIPAATIPTVRPVAATSAVQLLVSPTSFTLPLLPSGLDAPPMVSTVTNVGTDAVVMNGTVQSVGGFIASTDCQGLTLAPGDSCHMSYVYQPLPSTTSSVTSSGSWNGQSYSIDLNGSSGPGLLISPTGLDFGYVQPGFGSGALTVTVTNLDRHTVTLTGPNSGLTGTNATMFSVDRSDCTGKVLVQGASCHMTYTFGPPSPSSGSKSATSLGNWNGQSYSIALAGRASSPPRLTFSATSFDFGYGIYTTPPASQVSTITNSGIDGVTITRIDPAPGPYEPMNVGNGCVGVLLQPFDSCDMHVSLGFPNGGIVDNNATLVIHLIDSTAVSSAVDDTFAFHEVQVLPIALYARRFDFGDVPSGSTSAPIDVPFTNMASQPQSIDESNFNNAAPFAKTADCVGVTLAAGNRCSMRWVIAPTSVGPVTTLISGGSTSLGNVAIVLQGRGVGTPSAPLVVTASPSSGALRLTWQPPAANGGSAVTGYTITSLPAGVHETVAAGNPLALTIPVPIAVSYRFIVTAQNSNGSGPGATSRAASVFGEYVPVQPERLLDTRFGLGYVGAKPAAGDVVQLQITGVGATQVPSSAAAVVLNVTGTGATNDGFVTVWPCGQSRPLASNLNLTKGATAPNLVVVKLGDAGKVCLFTQSGTHLVADVNGYFPGTTSFHPVQPERLLETRAPTTGYVGGKPTAAQVVALQVTGVGATNVPADASAVVLNVTGVGATADGYVTVWPCGQTQPTASNLNLSKNGIVPNLVIAKIGVGGKVCLFTQSSADLVADINGWFPGSTGFHPVLPERLLETRPAQIGYSGPKPGPGDVVQLQVVGVGATQVPADASAVVLNVTGTGAPADGFVTVWPCGQTQPTASNLNLTTGGTVPNLVIVKLGVGGKVCLFTQSGTDLVADVNGWFPA